MSKIIDEFKEFFENSKVKGLYKWSKEYTWQEMELVLKFIREELSSTTATDHSKLDDFHRRIDELTELSTMASTGFSHYNIIQQTIIYLILEDRVGVLNLKGTQIKMELLDDEAIEEVALFYGLDNPKKRYKEIQTSINGPQSFLTYIPYSVLYGLYKKGKVPFDRQIFVACLIRYNVWHGSQYAKELSAENAKKFTTFFPLDEFTLDVLLAVFEMELGVNSAFYLDREHPISAVIFTLIKNGKYSTTQIQQKVFEAFNNPLLKQSTQSWMKNIYSDLELTLEENINSQEQIIGLLFNDVNLVVNFAIGLIKEMATHPKFNWQLLVDSLEGIVYREKLNAGLKTVLKLLQKRFKKEADLLTQSCINLAPIFLQTDSKVQIEAKKVYELLKEPNEEIVETLAPFVETMHTEVKRDLDFLFDEQSKLESRPLESYKQKRYKPKALREEEKLEYLQTEEEFIFLCSKVLKSPDFIDYELFLESFLRFSYLKDSHYSALKPALKQAEKHLDQFSSITARLGIHHRMAALLIVTWLKPNEVSIAGRIKHWQNELNRKVEGYGTAHIEIAREWLAQFKQFKRLQKLALFSRQKNKEILPLLSTPTHTNGEIDPQVLLKRLSEYQAHKQTPNQGDFDLALCRVNRYMTYNISEKATLEHQKILYYLLDQNTQIDTKEFDKLESSWLTAYALKNPKKSLEAVLAHRNHKEWLGNASWDWDLKLSDDNQKFVIFDLQIDTITPQENYFSTYLDIETFFVADISHWFSRNPFLLEFIYLKSINHDYRWVNYLEADETRSILSIVTESAKEPKPLGKAAYLFLTMSLFCKDKSIRRATLDWLLLLIENNYLELETLTTTVTKLLSNAYEHFIPIPRVCEQLDALFQMQGVYLDVVEKILEDLIPQMNSNDLPKSFSKVLHYYYEVLTLTQSKPSTKMRESLKKMREVNAVKKMAVKILNKEKDK